MFYSKFPKKFLPVFVLLTKKGFYTNFSILSENMIKYIEIFTQKFKTNTINIQRHIDIFSNYILTSHRSVIAKTKCYLNVIH